MRRDAARFSDVYDRNPRDDFAKVGCMYPLLPWQMDDLTPVELDAMIATVSAMAGTRL